MELNDLTIEIKHRESNIVLNFLKIGQLLTTAKKLLEHSEFTPYIERNFSFSPRHARRFMEVFNKFGLLSNGSPLKQLGITKLYLLTYIPNEELDEVIEKVKTEKLKTIEEIKREVDKFKLSNLPAVDTEGERHLKWLREGQALLVLFQDYKFQMSEMYKLKSKITNKLSEWILLRNKFNYTNPGDNILVNKIQEKARLE